MSSGDRGAHPTANAPVYAVYPGGRQADADHGFRLAHPPDPEPPPKYEDVVSGEYLKWNYASCGQRVSPDQTTNATLPPPPESGAPRQESHKGKNHIFVYAVALFLTATFIWRVAIM